MILTLSEGFVATAVALARRAGIEVPIPEPEAGHIGSRAQNDIQVPGNPRTASTAVATTPDTRAREIDRWMARHPLPSAAALNPRSSTNRMR